MSIAPIPVIHTIPKISVKSFNGLTLLLTSGAKVVFTTGLMTVLAAANPVCISGSAEYMMDCGTVSALGIRLNMLSSENGNKRRSPTSAQSVHMIHLGTLLNTARKITIASISHPATMLRLSTFKNITPIINLFLCDFYIENRKSSTKLLETKTNGLLQ